MGGEKRMKQATTEQQRLKNERINLILKFLMALLFLSGAIVFSYPFVSDAINNYYDQKAIEQLQEQTAKQNLEDLKRQKEELIAKNTQLLAEGKINNIPGMGLVEDPFAEAVGDARNPGVDYYKENTVGAIYIPTINVSLPVFKETNNVLLEKGATILQGTSYPIGGSSTHAVITGHSGLPDKKIFTDLEKLKEGDLFFLDIAGEKLAYQIMTFETVLPYELDLLTIRDGEDLVTLLTCTPYMINTHRLLVTGKRVPYPAEKIQKEIKETQTYHKQRFEIYMILIPIFFGTILYWMWRKFVYYQSIKYRYDFAFTWLQAGIPQGGKTFILIDKKGKEVILADGLSQVAISDAQGQVVFKNIPGGIYRAIHQGEEPLVVKGKVYLLKDKFFKIIRPLRYLKVCRITGKQGVINEVKKR